MNTLPEPSAGPSSMLLPIVAVGLMVAAVGVEMTREPAEVGSQRVVRAPSAADFGSAWRRDSHVDLQRTLAANKVEDCADMAYRPHRTIHGEYLVYCTRNGRSWTSWVVSTGAQRVSGPFPPDPLMPPPQ